MISVGSSRIQLDAPRKGQAMLFPLPSFHMVYLDLKYAPK